MEPASNTLLQRASRRWQNLVERVVCLNLVLLVLGAVVGYGGPLHGSCLEEFDSLGLHHLFVTNMWICKHCKQEFNFAKTAEKANHSRWCSKNPLADKYKSNATLRAAVIEAKTRKYGNKKEFTVVCATCNGNFSVIERETRFPAKANYYCSRACANSHLVTDLHRNKTKASMRSYYKKVGRSLDVLRKSCLYCLSKFETIKKTKKFCSKFCAATYRNNLARAQRPALTNYRADCSFRFNLKDYPEEFNFALVEQLGWYSPANKGNNLTGVSRDHMVSVRYGFDHSIPAEHIRHPANCRLLAHSDNSSKGAKNYITYEELLNRIALWEQKYKK